MNTLLAEYPQGDPFSGPAYGRYEKSKGLGRVLGVVAGVAAAATGFGMVGLAGMAKGAAAGALGGLTTLQGLAGGAMFAGGITQAIGSATGNKKLARIGSTLTLAGGVTSMAGDLVTRGAGAVGASMKEGMSSTLERFSAATQKVTASAAPTASAPTPMPGPNQAIDPGIIGSQMPATGSMSHVPAPVVERGMDAVIGSTGQSGGILSNAMTSLATPQGMNLIGSTIQGIGDSKLAKAQIAANQGGLEVQQGYLDLAREAYGDKREDLERELSNANFRYEIIDPHDPEAEQKRAAAAQAGIPTITLGVNPNAGPVMTQGVSMPANQFMTAGA